VWATRYASGLPPRRGGTECNVQRRTLRTRVLRSISSRRSRARCAGCSRRSTSVARHVPVHGLPLSASAELGRWSLGDRVYHREHHGAHLLRTGEQKFPRWNRPGRVIVDVTLEEVLLPGASRCRTSLGFRGRSPLRHAPKLQRDPCFLCFLIAASKGAVAPPASRHRRPLRPRTLRAGCSPALPRPPHESAPAPNGGFAPGAVECTSPASPTADQSV
jgi:hypothetical protein